MTTVSSVNTGDSAAISVVIVDDDPMVRAGLRSGLSGSPDIAVVGEAGDGVEALTVVKQTRPDVVLMDLRMPRRDGLATTRLLLSRARAARQRAGPKVVVLTTSESDDLVVEALRIGASGFLLKDTSPARLVEAVHAVMAGGPMLSPHLMARLVARVRQADGTRASIARERLSTLTDREREVAVSLCKGMSTAEIAEELAMGEPIVMAHMSRVCAKLGVDNRMQIALTVHDAGLA